MNDSIRFFQAAQHFVNKAKELVSVQEVVLCGSMEACDPYPGDIDLAVVLSHFDELPVLARFCRQMSSTTHAWEVFVFSIDRRYLGRICHKRECPGRFHCEAKDCGKTPHLRNIRGFRFDPALFLAPELKLLWKRHEESILLGWRKDMNLIAPCLETYEPIRIKCWECGKRFVFTASEQKHFEKHGWNEPKRCPECQENQWFSSVEFDLEGDDEDSK